MTDARSIQGTASPAAAWRIALLVLIVAAVFWLGGSAFRMFVGGELLKPGTLEFNDYLAPEAERELFRLLGMTSVVVIISYVGVLLSSVVVVLRSPWRLKDHGWLMMSAILFYLFVPVELFTLWLDGRMAYLEFLTPVDDLSIFRELFLARAGALAGAPIIAQFCYYTIIGLAVFQPFRRISSASA